MNPQILDIQTFLIDNLISTCELKDDAPAFKADRQFYFQAINSSSINWLILASHNTQKEIAAIKRDGHENWLRIVRRCQLRMVGATYAYMYQSLVGV